jgi:hypothetical protein
MKAVRRLQIDLRCCGRGAGLEHEHAADDTFSSRTDLPRANPVGVAAAGDHNGVLRQPALEQRSDSPPCGAKDQSRIHDGGFEVVPAAGVQRRVERLAPYRSRWRVHVLHDSFSGTQKRIEAQRRNFSSMVIGRSVSPRTTRWHKIGRRHASAEHHDAAHRCRPIGLVAIARLSNACPARASDVKVLSSVARRAS